jgi:hypothetical protein
LTGDKMNHQRGETGVKRARLSHLYPPAGEGESNFFAWVDKMLLFDGGSIR